MFTALSVRICLVAVICAVIAVQTAAADAGGKRGLFEDYLADYQAEMLDARGILESKPQTEWSQAEVEDYLFNALHSIYWGINLYIEDHRQQPYNSAVLQSAGIVANWPGNPFDNWKALEVSDSAQFKAGGIVRQLCPSDWYSGFERPVPLTYVLTIYGAESNYLPLNAPESFYDWATIPAGTAFSTASFFQSAEETKKKIHERENGGDGEDS